KPSVEDLPAILRYDHDVVLAVPPHMGQVLPLVHRLVLQPIGAFPEDEPMSLATAMHAGSLEALRVTRPEAVASWRNKQPRPEAGVLGRPPRGGRSRRVAPLGGGHAGNAPLGSMDVGKAPLGPWWSIEVKLALTTLQLLLFSDVLTDSGLV